MRVRAQSFRAPALSLPTRARRPSPQASKGYPECDSRGTLASVEGSFAGGCTGSTRAASRTALQVKTQTRTKAEDPGAEVQYRSVSDDPGTSADANQAI